MVNKSGQLLTELKKALEEDHKQREELIQEIKVGRRIKFNFLRLDLKPSNVAEHVLCFLSILLPAPVLPLKTRPLPSFSLQAIVAFIIDGDHWTLDLRPGKGFLVPGPPHGKEPADVVLKMSDATFVNLVMGKIASETAWLLRKIKISGSMLVAWRLDPVLDAAAAKLQA